MSKKLIKAKKIKLPKGLEELSKANSNTVEAIIKKKIDRDNQLVHLTEILKQLLNVLVPKWSQDPDFKETPVRVAKMYQHFFRDSEQEQIKEIMSKTFPTKNDQMVIVKDIECFGMCPHHLLPIVYKTHIGYIPNGKALGLSKFARIAIAVSSFPKLQENMTSEIADVLEKYLKPKGVMVVVNGLHGCMRCRGVEMDSSTVTSDCRGVLRSKKEAREEFLNLIK